MNPRKEIALDANILICGRSLALGYGSSWKRTKTSLACTVLMCALGRPKNTFHMWPNGEGSILPLLLTVLEEVSRIVVSVDRSLDESYEKLACERIQPRDPDDWPVVAWR